MTNSCAVLVLAAGLSSRMGRRNKLLLPLGDKTIIRHTVEHAVEAASSNVFVVTGHDDIAVRSSLPGLDVHYIFNDRYLTGMASSLVIGISALPQDIQTCIIMLGDMPLIGAHILRYIMDAARKNSCASAVVPVYHGIWSHPVALNRPIFGDIMSLQGDAGARRLLQGRQDVLTIPVNDEACVLDADTPDAYAQICARYASNHG